MSSEWKFSELGKISQNASRPFDFKKHKNVCFVNTGDVLEGFFLHSNITSAIGLPGQAKKAIKKGDILLTEIRPGNGRYAYVDFDAENYVVSTKFMVIQCGDLVDSRFLYHVIKNKAALYEFQRIAESRSGTFPQITFDSIAHFPVPIPPQSEQKNLVNFLDAIDERITLLRETNTTLEAIDQALFKSWFVDFDPVHAKQQGRAPEGMDAQTAALFPDSFEESELGMVPKGWRVGTLGDIAQTIKKQISSEQLHSSLNYVGLEHIPRKSLSLTTWGNAEGLESAKAKFGVGDVLFGKLRPYFHKVVIAPVDGVCSTDILVCSSKKPEYYGLVAMQLFSKELIDYADRLSNGAKMPRVNWSDLAAYPIAIPSEEISNSYTEFSKEIFEKMQQGVHQMQTLAKLRDTLLPRLISGQLRLPEAQAMAEVALAG